MPHFGSLTQPKPSFRGNACARFASRAAIASVLAIVPAAALAQSDGSVSREVVQPTPTPEVQSLNSALSRLARNSRDVSALVDAGTASLKVGDLDASMGFFGRALELSPNNARAKMGMAAVMVRSDRPIDALRLFAEAEQAGASAEQVEAERALAYDLVGNNEEAQASYRAVLSRREDPETTQRLAISQAIAGDREGFEQTLLPLLQKQNLAAYRARAFGLAILGDVDEASSIANAVMPKDLASRIAPYLAYMPRLTRSQQAAAANLGIFPRAAAIGRDDPRIAQYASSAAPAASRAADRLAPQGAPLNSSASDTRKTNGGDSTRSRRTASRPQREGAGPGRATSNAVTSGATTPAAPAATSSRSELPAVTQDSRLAAVAREQTDAPSQSATPRPSVTTFDLARVDSANQQQSTQIQAPPQTQPVVERRQSVADAFSGLASSTDSGSSRARAGAVDITSIEVPREAPPEPKQPAKPEPPKHPSRYWVQVATGRDRSALRFDWRRFARKAPDLLGDFEPHVVTWGQANRLLAGPVSSDKAARDLVTALKAEGLDSFTYTSPEGEEITVLQ